MFLLISRINFKLIFEKRINNFNYHRNGGNIGEFATFADRKARTSHFIKSPSQ